MNFGYLVTAMVTPLNDALEVDFDRAAELAKRLVEREGNDALVVCGTTGESPTLTKQEKLTLFKVVKEAVGPGVAVIAGTGSYDTRGTIDLSQEAAKVGADALLLVAPYYNKPSQEGLYQHFKTICDAVDLPAMLYNIPGRTGIEISPETLARLSSHSRIVAVKESLPSIDPISELSSLLKGSDAMVIYSGDDSNTLPQLSVGGYGVVSVAGHVAGRLVKEMIEKFHSGRVAEATALHRRLFPLFKNLFICPNPAPVKAALELMGFPVGGVRLPLVRANADEVAVVKSTLQEVGLL